MMVASIIKGRDNFARNVWETNQTYIAFGNFLTSAAMLGIDACPMEGNEPAKYDENLGLNGQGLTTVVAAAAGYRNVCDKDAGANNYVFQKQKCWLKSETRS